jgi:hypothetical protein
MRLIGGALLAHRWSLKRNPRVARPMLKRNQSLRFFDFRFERIDKPTTFLYPAAGHT